MKISASIATTPLSQCNTQVLSFTCSVRRTCDVQHKPVLSLVDCEPRGATIFIHSERALAPSLARRFQADLNNARILRVESSGQIDFYDDPRLIAIGADAVTRFFKETTR